MSKTTKMALREPILTVRIVPGMQTPEQRQKWMIFWKILIADAKQSEAKNG